MAVRSPRRTLLAAQLTGNRDWKPPAFPANVNTAVKAQLQDFENASSTMAQAESPGASPTETDRLYGLEAQIQAIRDALHRTTRDNLDSPNRDTLQRLLPTLTDCLHDAQEADAALQASYHAIASVNRQDYPDEMQYLEALRRNGYKIPTEASDRLRLGRQDLERDVHALPDHLRDLSRTMAQILGKKCPFGPYTPRLNQNWDYSPLSAKDDSNRVYIRTDGFWRKSHQCWLVFSP
ncbi:hypothetical protein DFH06DRAFT_1125165 [Mycena polygramma]|nr:hypothetical protein DFH06DRAFT_1125165 [Mycena polygramma]